MMFSTRPGEALPVRTPANSFCTTCSVFCILSSASSSISSIGIAPDTNKERRRCIERSQAMQSAKPGQAQWTASTGNEGADLFAQHHPLQIMRLEQVENDDRHPVVHAKREGSRVHHFQLPLQGLQITDLLEPFCPGILLGVTVVDAVHFRRL